ncbi:MAG TPA: sigma factor-like helix-turn-helix DNA-binding protein, partial [Methylophilaceae bacterium]|nr:sigma factor-like helix-turn-helix DNA-binding protein [Methylophilaceae bacterium]
SDASSLQPDEVANIARELKVKPEEVLEMESRMSGHEIPLEPLSEDESEEAYSPISYLQDHQPEPSELLAQRETERLHTVGLSRALESLDDRSRRIVQARWLQDGNGATLHDLAAEFGISAERVRQIENKAMQKMKTELSAAQ